MDIGDKVYHSWFGELEFIILDKRNCITNFISGKYDYLININNEDQWINGSNLIKAS